MISGTSGSNKHLDFDKIMKQVLNLTKDITEIKVKLAQLSHTEHRSESPPSNLPSQTTSNPLNTDTCTDEEQEGSPSPPPHAETAAEVPASDFNTSASKTACNAPAHDGSLSPDADLLDTSVVTMDQSMHELSSQSLNS